MGKQYFDANVLFLGALLFSAVAHFGSWYALGWVDIEEFSRLIAEIEFSIDEGEIHEVPELPEEEPEPEVEPEEPEPVPPPPRPEQPPEEEEIEPAPAEETPVEFDNIVLTNDEGDAGWAVNPGSGVESEGPIGRAQADVTGRNRHGQRNGQPEGTGEAPGPPVIPMAALSRRPRPPNDLNSMLQRFYPREARRQGVEGRSQIRIRINPDGSVRVLSTVTSTAQEFARACTQMLRQTHWRPALGPRGEPAATVTNFRCDFAVDY